MKGVILDLETAPIEGYTWGIWQQNLSLKQIKKPGRLLCLSYQWIDEKGKLGPVHSLSEWRDGEQGMAEKLAAVLDNADYIAGWNSKSYDERWCNAYLIERGISLPSPYKSVDLMRRVKKHFYLPSYKLEYVARWLGLGGKMDTGGFDLWLGVLAGDEKAQDKMGRYCAKDVKLTGRVFQKLFKLGVLHGMLPNQAIGKSGVVCPDCGSTDSQSRGMARTKTAVYTRYQCTACGGWHRSTRRVAGASTTSEVRG